MLCLSGLCCVKLKSGCRVLFGLFAYACVIDASGGAECLTLRGTGSAEPGVPFHCSAHAVAFHMS